MKIVFKVLLLFLLHAPLLSQTIELMDKISGGTVNDFVINNERERSYLLIEVIDSVWLNDQLVFVDTIGNMDGHNVGCLIFLNSDGTIKYTKNLGYSSGKQFITDSTLLLFIGFSFDSIQTTDISLIKSGPPLSVNLVAMEYNLEGDLLRHKQWPADHVSRFGILDITAVEDGLYLSGSFSFDTLTLDGQSAATVAGTGHSDAYVAEFNNSFDCQWIQSTGGEGNDLLLSTVTNKNGETILTGSSASTKMYCQGDSIVNPISGGSFERAWLIKINKEGDCGWIRQGIGSNSSHSVSAEFLEDNSIVQAGVYSGQEMDFGEIIVDNPLSAGVGFLLKYSDNGIPIFVKQIYGAKAVNVSDMIVSESDAIWVTLFSNSDTVFFESNQSIKNGEEINTYLIKYDQYGNSEFATSFWGNKDVSSAKLWSGPNNRIYVAIKILGDIAQISNGETIQLDSTKWSHTLMFEINEVVNHLNSKNGSFSTIKIFPNPLTKSELLNFEINNNQQEFTEFSIYSILGQYIKTEKMDYLNNQMNLHDLSSGIYLLHFKDQSGKVLQVSKLVVQ